MPRKYPIPQPGDVVGKLTIESVFKSGGGLNATAVCSCGNSVGPMRVSELFRRKAGYESGGWPRSCKSCSSRYATKRVKVYDDGLAKTRILSRYKNGASRRGIEWSITNEDFFAIAVMPCAYCGDSLTAVSKPQQDWKAAWPYTGVDRIDSSLGYVLGNVQPCCKWCNIAKNNRSQDEFLAWVSKVKHNWGKLKAK